MENGKPIIIGDHDPTLSAWVAEVCPVDLLRYYCVHGHYIGYKNVFPCPVCKGRPRLHPRVAQRQSAGTTRRKQQGRHLPRGRQASGHIPSAL